MSIYASNGKSVVLKHLAAGVLLLCLVGCEDSVLFSSLQEDEANKIIAVLAEDGVKAKKIPASDGNYSVLVEEHDFVDATNILTEHALPRKRFENLGDVFKDDGFVASAVSQKAKYVHALSQELASTISLIDGVLFARVHLVVPDRSTFQTESKASSASVFIKHRSNIDLRPYSNQIKALVVDGLDNIESDRVTVMFVPSEKEGFTKQSAQSTSGSEISTGRGLINENSYFPAIVGALFLLSICALLYLLRANSRLKKLTAGSDERTPLKSRRTALSSQAESANEPRAKSSVRKAPVKRIVPSKSRAAGRSGGKSMSQ